MIGKLEWTLSNAQQNLEQLQNPTMGVTTTNRQQQSHHLKMDSSLATGGQNAFYWHQTFTMPKPDV